MSTPDSDNIVKVTSEGDKDTYEHDSYAMVGISQVTGGPGRFFGSPFAEHMSHYRLRISRAVREHRYSEDIYFARENYIEIALTSAQFVELLTTINKGDGVPCTLQRRGGKPVAPPPEVPSERELARAHLESRLAQAAGTLRAAQAKVMETIKARVPKTTLAQVGGILDQAVQEIETNTSFRFEQFQRAMDREVVTAKREVDTFTTLALRAVGLAGLTDRDAAPRPLTLDVSHIGDEEEKER